ncbi:MAG: NAD(P)-dependent oxidoreductase [Myxococcales bacterium]|nr:NAD(P)-dependent oxidoreductase [Myxococcales bacterium]
MAQPSVQGKVLVTGASGFIGSRLRAALSAGGAEVVALRRSGSPAATSGAAVTADYDDLDALRAAVRDVEPDYVFHVAGVTKGVSYEDFQRGNVMPTANLIDAVRDVRPGLRRFVMASSLAAFGPAMNGCPVCEDDDPHPVEHYGQSKLEAEQALRQRAGGVPWTILRPSAVYGPGDVDFFNLFKSAAKGINVFFGNQARTFSCIYVDDCVRAFLTAATADEARGKGYFLADGAPLTWEAFQAQVVRATRGKAFTLNLPEALVSVAAAAGELVTKVDHKPRLLNRQKAIMGAQDAWTCACDAAREDFGFEAEMPLEDGVRRTAEWYRKNGWL